MFKTFCDHCKNEIIDGGRILSIGLNIRWHLCRDCFFKLEEWCIGESK